MRFSGSLLAVAVLAVACSPDHAAPAMTSSSEPSQATAEQAAIDTYLPPTTGETQAMSVYPDGLRRGDQLTFSTSGCEYRSGDPLDLWFLDHGERVGDPVPISLDGPDNEMVSADEYWVRVDLPEWQEPGAYWAEFPCPGGPTFLASWTVLSPRPEPTMEVSPLEITHAGEVVVELDCKVYDREERAYAWFDRAGIGMLPVVVEPLEPGGVEYRVTLRPEYWWPPGRYQVRAGCPGPHFDDIMPGDPSPIDLEPPRTAVELVGTSDHRWDWWRPRAGPSIAPEPDGPETDHSLDWVVPSGGDSATIVALCDGDIPRDEGARFVGIGVSRRDEDANLDELHVVEYPAERFVEADDGGVYIQSRLTFRPGDPATELVNAELTIIALCVATPPVATEVRLGEFGYPDDLVPVHVYLSELAATSS